LTDPDWLAERFEDHRAHLRGVAYRMLGSLAEAEDTVQDAWLRASRADAAGVENLGGWLTTIVARLALDRLRARASRREDAVGLEFPEPIVTSVEAADGGAAAAEASDPERQALLAESVGLAMLIVLDTLSPAERLAFVLHDTFGLPFDQIAPIVERTPEATRQLASRARRRIRGVVPATETPMRRQRELVEAFQAASRDGDFEALLRVLDPDVVVRADRVPAGVPGGRRVVRGAEAVAHQALAFRPLAAGARPAIVNGAAGGVVFVGDRPYAILAFTFRNDRIVELDVVADPDRLAWIDLGGVRP
jgi:RNA polymerase sigma-70 factor (ECF subfamily)